MRIVGELRDRQLASSRPAIARVDPRTDRHAACDIASKF